jgi:hypothetical protein
VQVGNLIQISSEYEDVSASSSGNKNALPAACLVSVVYSVPYVRINSLLNVIK